MGVKTWDETVQAFKDIEMLRKYDTTAQAWKDCECALKHNGEAWEEVWTTFIEHYIIQNSTIVDTSYGKTYTIDCPDEASVSRNNLYYICVDFTEANVWFETEPISLTIPNGAKYFVVNYNSYVQASGTFFPYMYYNEGGTGNRVRMSGEGTLKLDISQMSSFKFWFSQIYTGSGSWSDLRLAITDMYFSK